MASIPFIGPALARLAAESKARELLEATRQVAEEAVDLPGLVRAHMALGRIKDLAQLLDGTTARIVVEEIDHVIDASERPMADKRANAIYRLLMTAAWILLHNAEYGYAAKAYTTAVAFTHTNTAIVCLRYQLARILAADSVRFEPDYTSQTTLPQRLLKSAFKKNDRAAFDKLCRLPLEGLGDTHIVYMCRIRFNLPVSPSNWHNWTTEP